jgi:exosortase
LGESKNSGSFETQGGPNSDRSALFSGFTLAVIGLALAVAFRSVLGAPFDWEEFADVATWLFEPSSDSRAMAILVFAWLLWLRRKKFGASDAASVSSWHLISAVIIFFVFSWATWWRAPLLSALCVFAVGATIISARSGSSAVGYFVLPCLAILFSTPPPNPLLSEIVWWLQGVTAQGAHGLLSVVGVQTGIEGTELRMGEEAFAVIESCSGWRGISILLVLSVVAAELNSLSLGRTLTLAALAVPLGLALNIMRVATVVATQRQLDAELFESHTPQGIAVLLVGSLVLYAVAAWLGRSLRTRDAGSDAERTPNLTVSSQNERRASGRFTSFALSFSVALAFASILLPLRTTSESTSVHGGAPELPLEVGSWVGTVRGSNYFFPYNSGDHKRFHAEYRSDAPRTGLEFVDLFIANEAPQVSGLNRLPDSKLILPAMDWEVESLEHRRIPMLGVDAQSAILTRGEPEQLAYVIAWRVHDRGLWMESLSSLLGMDACDFFSHRCQRGVVRLAVPIAAESDAAHDRASRSAMRFLRSFQAPLMQLNR